MHSRARSAKLPGGEMGQERTPKQGVKLKVTIQNWDAVCRASGGERGKGQGQEEVAQYHHPSLQWRRWGAKSLPGLAKLHGTTMAHWIGPSQLLHEAA